MLENTNTQENQALQQADGQQITLKLILDGMKAISEQVTRNSEQLARNSAQLIALQSPTLEEDPKASCDASKQISDDDFKPHTLLVECVEYEKELLELRAWGISRDITFRIYTDDKTSGGAKYVRCSGLIGKQYREDPILTKLALQLFAILVDGGLSDGIKDARMRKCFVLLAQLRLIFSHNDADDVPLDDQICSAIGDLRSFVASLNAPVRVRKGDDLVE